ALGWSRERTRVIDADLGLSGKERAPRGGFTELVAEVSLGHVGIILGYEVSRLARNNADWYHLLDMAAVFGTLIADSDGVYDIGLERQQRAGLHSGELLWKRATYAAVRENIINPAYAGAFAYGRRQTDPRRQQPRRPGTGHLHKPMEEWLHLQQGVYPAYITW